jgi:predicted nucleic-acid-binding Zn-ribbon protein
MKILMYDIETTPIQAYTWGLWDQNIGINQIIKPTELLCFGARWYGSKKTIFKSVHHDGKEAMLDEIHHLMDEADVLMGWNSESFDHKHLNREFVENNMLPPSPSKDLDLMKVVKAQFRFPSNKLDYVAQALGVGSKVKHSGFDLWIKCMEGDAKAWAEMKKYQIQDVALLADLYDILLPWISSHPDYPLHNDSEDGCVSCGSEDLKQDGFAMTGTGKYPRYVCNKCGKWQRESKSVITTKMRPL